MSASAMQGGHKKRCWTGNLAAKPASRRQY